MQVERGGPVPVYRQVAAVIRARIKSGELQPGQAIPSEKQMEQEFGVARLTARKAVAVLREEGLVHTVMGLGTYVGQPREV